LIKLPTTLVYGVSFERIAEEYVLEQDWSQAEKTGAAFGSHSHSSRHSKFRSLHLDRCASTLSPENDDLFDLTSMEHDLAVL
jgi:hypothetical protein